MIGGGDAGNASAANDDIGFGRILHGGGGTYNMIAYKKRESPR